MNKQEEILETIELAELEAVKIQVVLEAFFKQSLFFRFKKIIKKVLDFFLKWIYISIGR
jgi:hypothetical protein